MTDNKTGREDVRRSVGEGPGDSAGFRACGRNPIRTERRNGVRRGPSRPTVSADPDGHPERPVCPGGSRSHPAPGRVVRCPVGWDAEGRSRRLSLAVGRQVRVGTRPAAGDASGQLPGQCRSSDSKAPVSRHTRNRGRAVHLVSDMPPVQHTGVPRNNKHPRGTGSVRTVPAGSTVRARPLPRRPWRSPTPRVCPDRPAARR